MNQSAKSFSVLSAHVGDHHEGGRGSQRSTRRNSFLHQLLNFDILMALRLFTPQSVCHKHKRRYNETDGHRKGWF